MANRSLLFTISTYMYMYEEPLTLSQDSAEKVVTEQPEPSSPLSLIPSPNTTDSTCDVSITVYQYQLIDVFF